MPLRRGCLKALAAFVVTKRRRRKRLSRRGNCAKKRELAAPQVEGQARELAARHVGGVVEGVAEGVFPRVVEVVEGGNRVEGGDASVLVVAVVDVDYSVVNGISQRDAGLDRGECGNDGGEAEDERAEHIERRLR